MTNQKELEIFVSNNVYVCMTVIIGELLKCSGDFQNAYYDEMNYDCDWLEVWSVSDYLAEKLRDEGEFVLEYGWHNLWFRTTSGQAIFMDGVIEDIYNELTKNY